MPNNKSKFLECWTIKFSHVNGWYFWFSLECISYRILIAAKKVLLLNAWRVNCGYCKKCRWERRKVGVVVHNIGFAKHLWHPMLAFRCYLILKSATDATASWTSCSFDQVYGRNIRLKKFFLLHGTMLVAISHWNRMYIWALYSGECLMG